MKLERIPANNFQVGEPVEIASRISGKTQVGIVRRVIWRGHESKYLYQLEMEVHGERIYMTEPSLIKIFIPGSWAEVLKDTGWKIPQ